MKLRYLTLALLTLMTTTVLNAQSRTATTVTAKAKTARSVASDVRNRKVQKAARTVLNDKDVSRHVKVDKSLQAKLTDPQLASNLRKAKTEARRDPITFAEKNAQELRKYKERRPKWLFKKANKRASRKK